MRRDVLHQVVAGGRRRNHRSDLQRTGFEARLWLRRVGLGDGLARGRRGQGLSGGPWRGSQHERRMRVMRFPAPIRLATFALMLVGIVLSAPAIAQKLGPDGAPNPTASVVDQQTLLKQVPRVEGRIDIPDTKAAVLIQPAGRTWDYFHEVWLRWGGAIVILGMIVVLGAAYLIMGRLRITAGRCGQKILRFKAFERFSHWLTAVSFVVLGLTGLNITFGKVLLLP